MTNLATAKTASSRRRTLRAGAATGAALGALLWIELIALDVPNIVVGRPGYNAIPFAALVGALLGLTALRRLLWAGVVALAALIAAVAYTPAVTRPVRAFIRADPVVTDSTQAVVVLSAGITNDGHLKQPAVDRLLTGASLVRRGVSRTLILSRERLRTSGKELTSDADQRRIVELLDPHVRLWIVDSIFGTRDEAVRVAALARPLGIAHVVLVTSPIHTRRACAAFEKVGLRVTCVPSESRDVAVANLRTSGDRVRALQRVLYECAAFVKYRLRGWI